MHRISDWRTIPLIIFIYIIFLFTAFALYLSKGGGFVLGELWRHYPRFSFWAWMHALFRHGWVDFISIVVVCLPPYLGYLHWWRRKCFTSYVISTLYLYIACNFMLSMEICHFHWATRGTSTPTEYLESLPGIIKWADKHQAAWQLHRLYLYLK